MEQETWQPLHEGGAQPDASLGIKGEGDMVGLKVSGNQCFVCELRKSFMSPSERVSYLRGSLPGGLFLSLDSEVNHRYINGRSAQSMDILCYAEVHG